MKQPKNIKDFQDFQDWCEDNYSEAIEALSQVDGMVRPVEEDDCIGDEEFSFIWTPIGQAIVLNFQRRLQKIALKHWPEEDLYLDSHYYREP